MPMPTLLSIPLLFIEDHCSCFSGLKESSWSEYPSSAATVKSIQTPAAQQKSWQQKLLALKMFLQNNLGFRDGVLPESLRLNLLLKGTVKLRICLYALSADQGLKII